MEEEEEKEDEDDDGEEKGLVEGAGVVYERGGFESTGPACESLVVRVV